MNNKKMRTRRLNEVKAMDVMNNYAIDGKYKGGSIFFVGYNDETEIWENLHIPSSLCLYSLKVGGRWIEDCDGHFFLKKGNADKLELEMNAHLTHVNRKRTELVVNAVKEEGLEVTDTIIETRIEDVKALENWNSLPQDGVYTGGSIWVAYHDCGAGCWSTKFIENVHKAWNIGDVNSSTFLKEENANRYASDNNYVLCSVNRYRNQLLNKECD